jgi:hypothetical protein
MGFLWGTPFPTVPEKSQARLFYKLSQPVRQRIFSLGAMLNCLQKERVFKSSAGEKFLENKPRNVFHKRFSIHFGKKNKNRNHTM